MMMWLDILQNIREDIFHFIFMTGILHRKRWSPQGKELLTGKKLLETAKKSGISDYGMIVEMETRAPGDPLQDLVECYNYLQNLKM